MFEYSKGYENDGSDTSYNIIAPEFETCVEILNYYLRLKMVYKNAPIAVVTAGGPDRKEGWGKEYNRDNIDELWDALRCRELT